MNGKYLLDTSIIIELFANDQAINKYLEEAESVFVPSIAVGELYYGANKSDRMQENMEQVKRLVSISIILNCDADTGYKYGAVKNQLRRDGKPVPENDIWIAALALQHDLTLATRDKHFEAIKGLKVETW
jgi:tRNA(fMet)-specific endonuclease VapC